MPPRKQETITDKHLEILQNYGKFVPEKKKRAVYFTMDNIDVRHKNGAYVNSCVLYDMATKQFREHNLMDLSKKQVADNIKTIEEINKNRKATKLEVVKSEVKDEPILIYENVKPKQKLEASKLRMSFYDEIRDYNFNTDDRSVIIDFDEDYTKTPFITELYLSVIKRGHKITPEDERKLRYFKDKAAGYNEEIKKILAPKPKKVKVITDTPHIPKVIKEEVKEEVKEIKSNIIIPNPEKLKRMEYKKLTYNEPTKSKVFTQDDKSNQKLALTSLKRELMNSKKKATELLKEVDKYNKSQDDFKINYTKDKNSSLVPALSFTGELDESKKEKLIHFHELRDNINNTITDYLTLDHVIKEYMKHKYTYNEYKNIKYDTVKSDSRYKLLLDTGFKLIRSDNGFYYWGMK